MMHGKPIQAGTELKGSEIIDLAPTILYLMGIDIPEDMDGKVLTSALTKDFVDTHQISYKETTQGDLQEPASTHTHNKSRD
jgi:arylsulfatase A-like enzyme